jgi:hypothetical protein
MTSLLYTHEHDPSDLADYDIEWADLLEAGETISASTWRIHPSLTKSSDTYGDTATKIWIRYGTPSKDHWMENIITTSGGRTFQRTVWVRVKQL